MKRVLVTGATGFLGKYLVSELIESGCSVVAVGRNEKAGAALSDIGAEFVKADFTEKASLDSCFCNIDCVIHAGALSTVWGKWEDFYNINVIGTKNMCELCLEHNVGRFVYVSSPSIYSSRSDRFDIREDDYDKNNDLNYYIKSKILAEGVIREYSEKGLYNIIIRPRGLFGIVDTSLIPRILRANSKIGIPLFNNGNNYVDITHVRNVAHACCLACSAPDVSGEVFNITNGEPTAFRSILEEFLAAIGEKPKYLKLPFGLVFGISSFLEWFYRTFKLSGEPALTKYTVCTLAFSQTLNIEKAREKLGYTPIISLSEGIKEYGQWWKENKKS